MLLADSPPSHVWMLWILCWAASSACVSLLLRIGPARLISERRLTPNIVVVGPQPQAGLLASIMSLQGGCNVLAQFSSASPADMTRLEEMAWAGRLDKIVLAGITPQDAERIWPRSGRQPGAYLPGLRHTDLSFDEPWQLTLDTAIHALVAAQPR